MRRIVIAVDARPLCKVGNGISRFVLQVLSHFSANSALDFVLLSNRSLHPDNGHLRWRTVIDGAWSKVPGTIWYTVRMNILARRYGAQVIWGTAHILPFFRAPGFRYALTVHDLVHEKFPRTMRRFNLLLSWLLFGRSINNADRIVAVSQTTKNDLIASYPRSDAKVSVIYSGKTELHLQEDHYHSSLPEPYLFCLGSQEPRKNLEALLEFFARLPESCEMNLVIAGADKWRNSGISKKIQCLNLGNRVFFAGYLSDDDVAYYLTHAYAFVFPSLYEGFGLPALEAADYCPVVLNDIPVFREISSYLEHAIVLNFADPDVAYSMFLEQMKLGMKVARLRPGASKLFSWDSCSNSYCDVFADIIR